MASVSFQIGWLDEAQGRSGKTGFPRIRRDFGKGLDLVADTCPIAFFSR